MEQPRRSDALDTLRGIAVLLVLFRHMPLAMPSLSLDRPQQEPLPDWLFMPLITLKTGGWAGVDLFFVLSGFLVSGLLFREWLHSGHLRVGRFLVRRGLKIYPAFYAMLIATVGYAYSQAKWPGWDRILVEAVFVQNYWPGIFPHTWTLAIEEHFYIALPLLLFVFRGKRDSPFRMIPVLVIAVAATCMTLRLIGAGQHPGVTREAYVPTHLRCDSLFIGVGLAWVYHFRRLAWDRIGAALGPALPLIAIAGFAPAFIWELEETRMLTTWGFASLYIGAGALLVWFMQRNLSLRPVAIVGFYSYSIYLWHISLGRFVAPMIHGPHPDQFTALGVYFGLTIAGGILLSWIFEIPALHLRDRIT